MVLRPRKKICGDPDLAATRVLILTTFENDTNIVAALRAGASGFIGKGSEPEELARAVRAVANGDALLSPLGDPESDYPHAATHRDRPGAVCEPGAH